MIEDNQQFHWNHWNYWFDRSKEIMYLQMKDFVRH